MISNNIKASYQIVFRVVDMLAMFQKIKKINPIYFIYVFFLASSDFHLFSVLLFYSPVSTIFTYRYFFTIVFLTLYKIVTLQNVVDLLLKKCFCVHQTCLYTLQNVEVWF